MSLTLGATPTAETRGAQALAGKAGTGRITSGRAMTAPAAPPGAMPRQRRRMGGLLWQRDFRLFLAGETVSLVGDAAARVAMPLLAVLVLHAGTFAVAFLTATGYLPWLLIGLPAGAGGLIGALLAGRLSRHLGSARALLLCALGAMPFSMIIPLTGPGPRLAYFIAGMLITGGGVVAGSIILVSFRQAYCPPPLLGRVTATMRFLLVGTNPVGALAAGGIGTWLGVREALWAMLGIATASGAMLLTRAFLGIRELPARR
jgi:hypothetical protein